jgi:hypothetical protein
VGEILNDAGRVLLFVGAVSLFGWIRWRQLKRNVRDLGDGGVRTPSNSGKKDPEIVDPGPGPKKRD